MRVALNKLLEKLGVGRVLSPYEAQPWFHYDAEKGITCSAEVRMGPGGQDLEAEIQYMADEKGEGDTESSGSTEGGGLPPGMPEQIMRMRALPVADQEWSPKELKVKGEDYVNKIHNWEEKGCNFFQAFIGALQMGQLPDIDALIEKELADDDFGGGKRGRIGRKSPKVKPGQLMGLGKKGM
jgi:hypothetical protein